VRDQRLALEWVRDNIAVFGGDPGAVTIEGQSSGGLAVTTQLMAYGGARPVPFQQAVTRSQALAPGITGNYTREAMGRVAEALGCGQDDLPCLRALDTETVLNASIATYLSDTAHNLGDIWLPVVDGDFIPAPPSQLLREGRFARGLNTMIGWADEDLTVYMAVLGPTLATEEESRQFVSNYLPGVSSANIDKLMALYPVSEFRPQENLTAIFYRTARIYRDIIVTCLPLWYGEQVSRYEGEVFLYDWNQTMLEPGIQAVFNPGGPIGPPHTAETAYIYGNITHWDTNGWPYNPTKSDFALAKRGSRSWSAFAATGVPGNIPGKDVFQGWKPAFSGDQTYVFVAGGSKEGLSAFDGKGATPAIEAQRLKERCGFLSSKEVLDQMNF
jgi:carboxylesterase type B